MRATYSWSKITDLFCINYFASNGSPIIEVVPRTHRVIEQKKAIKP